MQTPVYRAACLRFQTYARFLQFDSIVPLANVLDEYGFHPLLSSGRGFADLVADFKAALVENYSDYEAPGNVTADGPRQRAFCPLVLDGLSQNVANCVFSWFVFFENGREMAEVTLNGNIRSEANEADDLLRLLANKLLEIGKPLSMFLQSEYGYIQNLDIEAHPFFHTFDPYGPRDELVTLSWVNFYGPAYVRKYGRDLLHGIPGVRVEDLDDGGILYQSRESILVENELQHLRWQKEAQQFLAQHGISIRFDYLSLYD